MPHNPGVLPLDLVNNLPFEVSTDSPITWIVVGAGAAVAALLMFRRARRLALLATAAIVVGVVAWNNGLLPPAS